MALTPREEREIQQIEDSLVLSDPGFAARMNHALRPRRRLVVVAVCLLLIAVGIGLSTRSMWAVSLACTPAVAFVAGWCLGRAGPLGAPRLLRARVARAPGAAAGRVARLVRRRHR